MKANGCDMRKMVDAGWPALVCAGIVAVVQWMPGMNEAFQYDRAAILRGDVWRIVTGHFCHWSTSHWFWDSVVFLVAGYLVLMRVRALFSWSILMAAVFGSGCLLIAWPELDLYRGLSGIDCALVMAVAGNMFLDDGGTRNSKLAGFLLLLLIVAKTAWETTLGSAVFATGAFLPAPSIHLVGFVVGAVGAVVFARNHGGSGADRDVISVRNLLKRSERIGTDG